MAELLLIFRVDALQEDILMLRCSVPASALVLSMRKHDCVSQSTAAYIAGSKRADMNHNRGVHSRTAKRDMRQAQLR